MTKPKQVIHNRWQHFVPAGYLQAWETEQSRHAQGAKRNGRKARVWRWDCTTRGQTPATCEDICAADFTYSRDTESEKRTFEKIDGELPKLVRHLQESKELKPFEQWQLFLIAIVLHVRNPEFEIEFKQIERLDIIGFSATALLPTMLGFDVPTAITALPALGRNLAILEYAAEHFYETWTMQVLVSMTNEFITSAHPSLFITGRHGRRELWLPVSPGLMVVFHQRDGRQENSAVSPRACDEINDCQALNSHSVLFSHRRFTSWNISMRLSLAREPTIERRTIGFKGVNIWYLKSPNFVDGGLSFRRDTGTTGQRLFRRR